MSLSYQNNWERLQHLYVTPKVFTDRCERPDDFEKMPTVECGSVCVSLVEAEVEGGEFLICWGWKKELSLCLFFG
jgi:hypothetical protein